jgi:hypothetical protein
MLIQQLLEAETPKLGKPVVYLDMDGVLADFAAGYNERFGTNYQDGELPVPKEDPNLAKLQGSDFFSTLPKFDSADALVGMVTRIFGSYKICSSPLRGDLENSKANKTLWLQQHLRPQPGEIVITGRKEKYAVQPDGTPNILIDDKEDNISKWNEAGGIGIHYAAKHDSLEKIMDELKSAANRLHGDEQELDERRFKLPTDSQCKVKRLSNVRYATCVALGLRAHDSDHTDGTGKRGVKGTGRPLRGRKAKSEIFGGPVKDYSGKPRV